MLIGLKEALDYAEKNNAALAAINTPNLEMLLAVIKVAERYNIPMVVQHAEVHEPVNAIEDIGPCMVELAKRSTAPLVVHIDHGESFDYVKRGFDVGFNSAMIDGSRSTYEENLEMTKQVVELANSYGFGVEAELGVMPGREDAGGSYGGGVADETLYTDPQLAKEFVAATGVTALACSFGTVHGLYKAKPSIKYDLITELRQQSGVPIVMHGGSGLTPEEYRNSIDNGVRKINYWTYADRSALDAVKKLLEDQPDTYLFADAGVAATQAMEANVDGLARILYKDVV